MQFGWECSGSCGPSLSCTTAALCASTLQCVSVHHLPSRVRLSETWFIAAPHVSARQTREHTEPALAHTRTPYGTAPATRTVCVSGSKPGRAGAEPDHPSKCYTVLPLLSCRQTVLFPSLLSHFTSTPLLPCATSLPCSKRARIYYSVARICSRGFAAHSDSRDGRRKPP